MTFSGKAHPGDNYEQANDLRSRGPTIPKDRPSITNDASTTTASAYAFNS